MSGATIGGVIGGVIGFWVGGPQGAQVGWMIGSAVGGYVDPEKVQGPRLTDAQQQTSRDGIPITWGFGTFPTAGNLIWVQPGPPTEHKKTERVGKGGSVKETTFTYTRSYAIGICRGLLRADGLFDPIAGILMVKRNGKIVYDTRPDDILLALGMSPSDIGLSRAGSAGFLATVRFYLGGETQLPDPTIESWEGVNNAPAHRGLAYMVGVDHDVTRMEGAIDQYEFVVSTGGDVVPGAGGATWLATSGTKMLGSVGGLDWTGPLTDPVATGPRFLYGDGTLLKYSGSEGYYSLDGGDTWAGPISDMSSGHFGAYIGGKFWLSDSPTVRSSTNGISWDSQSVSIFGANTVIGGHPALIVLGDNAGRIKYSTDGGSSWSGVVNVFNGNYVTAIGSDGSIVVAGSSGGQLAWTDDGATWHTIATPFPAQPNNFTGVTRIVAGDNGIWVATSNLLAGADGQTAYSVGGTSWQYATGTLNFFGQDVDYSGGLFVQVGLDGSDGRISTSTDGNNWTGRPNQFDSSGTFTSVVAITCTGTPIPDAPGYTVRPDGSVCGPVVDALDREQVVLATIVADLFRRAGLDSDEYDVSQLTDLVDGYRIASEGGIDSFVAPLMQGYFFDVADWDAKVYCIKRGGASALTLTMDDLAARDGDAIEWERIQEAELLRKVTVGYISPDANFNTTTQVYERRAGTIQAHGESAIGMPIVTDDTSAAQIAEKRTNVAWAETDRGKFCLPTKFTRLTATDVITIEDEDGVLNRVRLMQKEDDSGLLMFESPRDRQSAYTGSVAGVGQLPPTFPGAALIGPTQLVVMNLPVLSEAHDEVGLYIAGRGYFSEWGGAQVQMSTDSGATFQPAAEITVPSVIGYTTSSLTPWVSSEYPSVQTVDVWLPSAPSSVDYATLLRYSNRAALQLDDGTWEVLQYQTVVANGDNSYTLSGLLRGRYNTTPGEATSGATFVLLDSSVQFVRAERWMIGESFDIRAVSYGTDPDAAGIETFDFTTCVSQTEWEPHYVQAERDVSDNINTSCIVRGRLGVETGPYHSKYFTGIRFSYSDGIDTFSYDVSQLPTANLPTAEHEYTVAQQIIDFGGSPSTLDVTVSALNSITGAGPATEAITV